MAKETSKDVKMQAVQEPVSEKEQKIQESVYTVDELTANAGRLFGYKPECVSAALRAAGRTGCTVFEAREIVNRFMKKEVR